MICGIALPLTAREISESYIENQNTVNNILLILKCYIYRCRCKGEITHLHEGLQYLKYYIKIEKNSTFYMSPKQTEQINKKKWLNVDAAMNGWLSLDTYIIVFVLVFYIACMKTKYHLYIYIYISKRSRLISERCKAATFGNLSCNDSIYWPI